MKFIELLVSTNKSQSNILMNAGTFNNSPLENNISPWLLPCICIYQRWQCNAQFKLDVLCVKGLLHQNDPPEGLYPNLTISFIKFKYCNL